MKIIGVDLDKCIRCEQCIKECPAHLFHKKESESQDGPIIFFEDQYDMCIKCGHCISICPKDAVIAEGLEELGGLWEYPELKDPSKIIEYIDLQKFLRARRSIRRFQDKKIPLDVLEKILESMRYAPSASNKQRWRYTVITDREKIDYFKDKVMEMFYLIRKILKFSSFLKFFVSDAVKQLLTDPGTKPTINMMIEDYENGGDPIFYEAPCVILLDSPKYGNMAGNDAGIALAHGMLAAESLGLGSCWIGFAQEAVNRKKVIRKWLNYPKGNRCHGALILGYPKMRFLKAPPRKKLRVNWI
jgi:nitroreductase/NAD-dependent dihydropyrimidine dehydrogenase PreA subunit